MLAHLSGTHHLIIALVGSGEVMNSIAAVEVLTAANSIAEIE